MCSFQLVSVLVFTLLGVGFFSLFERKLMGLMQTRKGPNKVSVLGLLQPIVDAIKLILKTESLPSSSLKSMYFLSPLLMFSLIVSVWVTYPFYLGDNLKYSFAILMFIMSLGVYGVILSGWYSNSKYALLGSSRALVQSVSYEVGLSLLFLILMVLIGSLSIPLLFCLQDHTFSLSFFFLPLLGLFLICYVAELSRPPFDLSEGESELVSGYSVEYGGLSYTLLFMGEIASLLWASLLLSVMSDLALVGVYLFFMVWLRATLPRVRFDWMTSLFWLYLLPKIILLSVIYLV